MIRKLPNLSFDKMYCARQFGVRLLAIISICCTLGLWAQEKKSTFLDNVPFPEKAYKNTKRLYCAVGMGRASDADVAHEIALKDAKARLTKAVINAFDDNLASDTDELKKFPLINFKVQNEQDIPGGHHENTCWLIISIDREGTLEYIENEYNKILTKTKTSKEFREAFEKEMNTQKNKDY